MKRYVVPAFLALFLSGACQAADSPFFKQANDLYQSGDYKGAAGLYQKAVQTGQRTAAVHYNLGNAALKSGEKGQALVYYERALRAAPRDKDLRWNLQVLKNSFPDRIEDRSYFVLALLREFLGQWTSDELASSFASFLALLAAVNVASLVFSGSAARLVWLRTAAVAGLLIFGALFGLKSWDTKDPRAVVLDKEVYAHYGPSDRETRAFLLHEGAEGRVLDTSGDWVYLSLQNRNTGWIRKNSCEIV